MSTIVKIAIGGGVLVVLIILYFILGKKTTTTQLPVQTSGSPSKSNPQQTAQSKADNEMSKAAKMGGQS